MQEELNLTEDKKQVVEYGLAIFFSSLMGYSAIIIVSAFFGVVKLALIATITTAGLRVLSGGAHSHNAVNCSLLGAVLSPTIALFSKYCTQYFSFPVLIGLVVTVWLFAMWSVNKYAPADTPNKPITDARTKQKLRGLSMTYLICWLILALLSAFAVLKVEAVMLLSSTLGLAWQGFSLTPLGYKLVAWIDALLP